MERAVFSLICLTELDSICFLKNHSSLHHEIAEPLEKQLTSLTISAHSRPRTTIKRQIQYQTAELTYN